MEMFVPKYKKKRIAINESIYFSKYKKIQENTKPKRQQETEAYVANVNVVLCGKAKNTKIQKYKKKKYLQEFMKSFGIE